MKAAYVVAAAILVLALAIFASGRVGPSVLAAPGEPAMAGAAEGRSISVTGDAEVRVVPNQVVLTLGVETSDKDLNGAKRKNDEIVRSLLALGRDQGIDAKRMQTDHISIEPRYHDGYEQKNFVGYFVRQTVVITLDDTGKFEGVLSGALQAGANYVHGIEFRTTELRKYRDQARALAIRAAKEKAVAMAGVLDQQVGEPLSIREESSGWWSGYNAWWGSRWGGAAYQNVSQSAGPGVAAEMGALAPGEISVTARVAVDFALR